MEKGHVYLRIPVNREDKYQRRRYYSDAEHSAIYKHERHVFMICIQNTQLTEKPMINSRMQT